MKSIITGEAAHICAASNRGPRHDPNQTPEVRKAITNAIWLCGNCNKKVDTDWRAWPKERLLEMKALHERWIAAEAMIPTLPEVKMMTLPHLRLNAQMQNITGELQEKIREQEIVIKNPNRVELLAFSLQMSLPESIVRSGKIQFHTGATVAFKRVEQEVVGFVKGNGAITANPPQSTTQCLLEVDKLPPESESRFAFYTIVPDETMPYSPGAMGREFFGNPEDLETTKVCHFYLEGKYQYLIRGEYVKASLFVPILYIAADRKDSTLSVQTIIEPFRVYRFMQMPSFTMHTGRAGSE